MNSQIDVYISDKLKDVLVYKFHQNWDFASFKQAMIDGDNLIPNDKVRAYIADLSELHGLIAPWLTFNQLDNSVAGADRIPVFTAIIRAPYIVHMVVELVVRITGKFRGLFNFVNNLEEAYQLIERSTNPR